MTKKFTTLILISSIFSASLSSAQCIENSECDAEQVCIDGNCRATAAEEVDQPALKLENADAGTDNTLAPAPANKERIKPLWISGLAAFGAFYVANIVISGVVAAEENKGKAAGYAAIPLVGQFISISKDSPEYPIGDYKGPMILGAVLQFVAVGVFTTGLIIKREPKEKKNAQAPHFIVSPTLTASSSGALFHVSF